MPLLWNCLFVLLCSLTLIFFFFRTQFHFQFKCKYFFPPQVLKQVKALFKPFKRAQPDILHETPMLPLCAAEWLFFRICCCFMPGSTRSQTVDEASGATPRTKPCLNRIRGNIQRGAAFRQMVFQQMVCCLISQCLWLDKYRRCDCGGIGSFIPRQGAGEIPYFYERHTTYLV